MTEKNSQVRNLLFVDDEPNFLDSLRRMLRRQDQWRLSFASGVDEALRCYEQQTIDVIISDVNMPGKSGFDLLIALQARGATVKTPVIILTGNGEHDIKRRALAAGATDLLNKPVEYQDLVARIASVLRIRDYQQEIEEQKSLLETRVRQRTAQLEFLHYDLLWRLAKAAELRDEETGNHVVRVAHYSKILARHCALTTQEVDWIFVAAPLHDLGKIGIPDAILLKPGPLTAQEWQVMRSHCQIGYRILMEDPHGMADIFCVAQGQDFCGLARDGHDELRQMAAIIALNHHEKWDGSGYPQGLEGNKIPLAGRIVALADVFDALCSKRPYKGAMGQDEAAEIIHQGRGSHFEPDLVDIFGQCQGDFSKILQEFN